MIINKKFLFLIFFFLCFVAHSAYAEEEGIAGAIAKIAEQAQQGEGNTDQAPQEGVAGEPNVITMMATVTLLALLPYAFILLASFLKIVIVHTLRRKSLGVQQSPPNRSRTVIALLMSIYVIFPTCVAMYDAGKEYLHKDAPKNLF